jgi:CHAT domain-containing protein
MEAVTLNNIGLVYKARNDHTQALHFLNQALERRRAVGDRAGEGTTISDIGSVYAQLGQTDKALNFYQQAIQLSRDVQDRNTEASTLRRLALLERDQGDLQNARTYLETSLSIIENLRTKIVGQELRSSYFASTHEFFDSYIEVLMRLHRINPDQGLDGLALEAAERSRARALLDSLVEAKANIREGIDPELLERERSLQKRLNDIAEREAREVGSMNSDQQSASVKKETASILTDYEEVEAEIRAKSPRFAALMYPVPLSVKQIQEQIIDADTLLLEYSLASERSYVWAVTSNSVSSFELPPHDKIDTAARQLYASLTARNKLVRFEKLAEQRARIAKADADYISTSAELSQMLLGPVASLLGKRRLLIVADGSLNYLPFAALPVPTVAVNEFAPKLPAGRVNRKSVRDNKASKRTTAKFKPLIVDHEVVSLPSASALASLRLELRGRSPAPKTLAVLADPVFEKNDERFRNVRSVKTPRSRSFEFSSVDETDNYSLLSTRQESVQPLQIQRLPFTRREADEILSLVPKNETFAALGFDANRTIATSPLLGQYKYVHFATHGFINAARPELTGMVLSLVNSKGIEQNGFLWAHEIYNLRLPAEMVVLSGCRTGLGKEIKGEGLVGLTRGFMYAGASRVLVSLWAVSDEASAELMGNLYKAMLKENLSPSAALRSAQLAVLNQKRWESPYYWAAFVLQGEPQ